MLVDPEPGFTPVFVTVTDFTDVLMQDFDVAGFGLFGLH